MKKDDLKYSAIQSLRFEFDNSNTTEYRKIEIAKTTICLGFEEEAKEMADDLRIDNIITNSQEREIINLKEVRKW